MLLVKVLRLLFGDTDFFLHSDVEASLADL